MEEAVALTQQRQIARGARPPRRTLSWRWRRRAVRVQMRRGASASEKLRHDATRPKRRSAQLERKRRGRWPRRRRCERPPTRHVKCAARRGAAAHGRVTRRPRARKFAQRNRHGATQCRRESVADDGTCCLQPSAISLKRQAPNAGRTTRERGAAGGAWIRSTIQSPSTLISQFHHVV